MAGCEFKKIHKIVFQVGPVHALFAPIVNKSRKFLLGYTVHSANFHAVCQSNNDQLVEILFWIATRVQTKGVTNKRGQISTFNTLDLLRISLSIFLSLPSSATFCLNLWAG